MGIERTRVLTRNDEQHPVMGMIDQAAGASAPMSAPAAATPPAPAIGTAQVAADPVPESGKKQVNYRLAPAMIEDLKRASIVYSYRRRGRISQNQIVELAVAEWLDANGPWEM